MVCITLLCVQPIPVLSAFFLCHPYIPLSNLKNFSITCIYRDDGGGLTLSVYIRKLSFSPSISGQMDSYLHHCDYTIKATIGLKMGSF